MVGLMDAVRCVQCGATRWALTGVTLEHMLGQPCELCGGKTTVERRHPGTGASRPFNERRDLEQHPRPRVREPA
jgi:hypothetical protein